MRYIKKAVWTELVTKISAVQAKAEPHPAQLMRLTKTAQGGDSPLLHLPWAPRVTEAQWGAESPHSLHSAEQGWSTFLLPTRLGSAVPGGNRATRLLWIHKAKGSSGCRPGWHSTPSSSALVVAGSAGNWHYNSNLQEEKVNIQTTNCFYFCYRGAGVWSRGEPSGHVNIHKHPTLIRVNRKPSWFKNNNNNN